MKAAAFVLAPLLFLAGAMISPTDMPLSGLAIFVAIMLVALPFIAWPTFLLVAIFPTPGMSRSGLLVLLWIGASLLAVAVIYFVVSAMAYPNAGVKIAPDAHLLIPFAPRLGIAIGLFCLCILVSRGCWGVLSPLATSGVVAAETLLAGAFITAIALFALEIPEMVRPFLVRGLLKATGDRRAADRPPQAAQ